MNDRDIVPDEETTNQENRNIQRIHGLSGEEKTFNVLSNGSIHGYHRVVRNALLKDGSGIIIAEIDVLVLSTYGVFVIENKEYCGSIKITKNLTVLKNAFTQNNRHVNFLRSRLHILVKDIYSIIVFPETAKGQNNWEIMPHVFVVKRPHLRKVINDVIDSEIPKWNPDKVDEMAESLLNEEINKSVNPHELTQEKTRDSIRM